MIDFADFKRQCKDLEKRFTDAPTKVEQSLAKSVKKAAKAVEAGAVFYAPVDTGELRHNIHVRKVSDTEYEVVSDIEYAKFVHDGTRFQKPNPYLRRSLVENQEFTKDLIKKGAVRSI